jgi:hypothetical protein
MASYDDVIKALRAADAAGNVEDARKLAQIANSMRQTKPQEPSFLDRFRGTPSWMQSKDGATAPEAAGGDMTNPMAYLSEEQKTEQGPAMKAVGQGVNRAVQVGAGLAKGAVINPATAAIELLPGIGTDYARAVEQSYQQQRKSAGAEGFDWAELVGAIASPVNQLVPMGAATTLGRVGQGVVVGGVAGGLTPTGGAEGTEFIVEKLKQIGLGGLFGGGLTGVTEAGSKLISLAREASKPFTSKGVDDVLRQQLNELTGGKADEVIAAVRSAPETVPGSRPTVAQAVADIPEAAGLAVKQNELARQFPDFYKRQLEQEAARTGLIRQVGGTADELAAAEAARTAQTTPLRETALKQANIAGELQPRLEQEIASKFQSKARALQTKGVLSTEASQQQQLAENFYPIPGQPRFPARYTENIQRIEGNLQGAKEAGNIAAQRQAEMQFKQLQLQSLADNGFYPLKSQDIVSKIDSVLAKPEQRASDVVFKSLSSIREKLANFTDPATGVIDSGALYTIRKEIGNDIKKFASESQNWDNKLTAGLEKNLKSYIDNAIEKASGSNDWKNYLTTYAKASDKINRMQVGQELEKRLGTALGNKENAGGFATAFQEAAQTIKRSTGQARFQKLEDVLTPSEMTKVNAVISDLERAAKAQRAGRQLGANGEIIPSAQIPQMLSRTATILNQALKLIKMGAEERANLKAKELFLNPQLFADFLSNVPVKDATVIAKAFRTLSPETQAILESRLTSQAVTQGVVPSIVGAEE